MKVEEYLQNGKSFEDLENELGVKCTYHPTLSLVILNYSQINSPKTHPIVRECRGLVMDKNTKTMVSRSFPRFFNWGEVADEMGNFDFRDFASYEKVDGSLVLIYHHDGRWHCQHPRFIRPGHDAKRQHHLAGGILPSDACFFHSTICP